MVTMKDIAEKAGVSRPTVSAVLNPGQSSIRIGAETRKRILQIAAEMGYLPNENARAVRSGHTRIIGVIGNSNGSFAARIFRGIAWGIQESGYSMKLVIPSEDEGFANAVQRCAEQRVCGIIFFASDQGVTPEVWEMTRRYQIPAVLLSSNESDLCGCRITSDDEDGIEQAVRHLQSLGHSRIGFVSEEIHKHYLYAIRRRTGFVQSMAENYDPALDFHLHKAQNNSPERYCEILDAVRRKDLTAVICGSDYRAARLLQQLHRAGIRVPQEVSVIGFGDLECAPLLTPALTTVAQPFLEMGRRSVSRVLQLIREPEQIDNLVLPVQLMIRETTGKI